MESGGVECLSKVGSVGEVHLHNVVQAAPSQPDTTVHTLGSERELTGMHANNHATNQPCGRLEQQLARLVACFLSYQQPIHLDPNELNIVKNIHTVPLMPDCYTHGSLLSILCGDVLYP